MYVERGYPRRRISAILRLDYGVEVSINTIKRVLNRAGVDTSKGAGGGTQREVTCATCGRVISVPRFRERLYRGEDAMTKLHRRWQHHCDEVCWRVYLEEHCANQSRALRVVADILDRPLPAGAVAHFIDGDRENVLPRNLRVFTSTEAHVRVHRQEDQDHGNRKE